MKKDDYRSEFEEHRQEIDFIDNRPENETRQLPSRASKHRKSRKKKRKSNHLMINTILGVFTLIPIIIFLSIVINLYYPNGKTTAKVDDSRYPIETNENENAGNPDNTGKEVAVNKDDEDDDDQEIDKNDASEDSNKESEQDDATGTNLGQDSVQGGTTPVSKEEAKPAKTHTVIAGETLWRIAMKYYQTGDEATLEKIIKANGLLSNEIIAGQTLIIP
jgi:LysM repeat protein